MTSLQEIQDYRDHPNISQSELKAILGKGSLTKPSLSMLLGNYLDVHLLTPHLQDELFIVWNGVRPTQTIVDMCDSLYNWIDSGLLLVDVKPDLNVYRDEIEQWIETQSYYSNRPNTRVNKFIEEAKDWWDILTRKGDKQIITGIEQTITELITLRLLNDYELEWLWKGEFQKPFYWTEEEIGCKGLGDILTPNCYVDLKFTTCRNLDEWWKICANLNYPFQMAFYKSGLKVDKCKWLVVNNDWHQLVDVTEIQFQIGKWGYSKTQKIKVGKVEFEVEKKTPGYMDGLEMIKGKNVNNDPYLNAI